MTSMHDWKPITGYDGYVVNRQAEVWSVGRTIRTKGGATRTTVAKPLKPDAKNRVALRRDGKTFKVNAAQIAAEAFPPTRHYIAYRFVTLTCRWCRRDFRDIIKSYCENAPTMWPALYRCPHCTTAVIALPDHFPTLPLRVGKVF
jgi:hypothetical protein